MTATSWFQQIITISQFPPLARRARDTTGFFTQTSLSPVLTVDSFVLKSYTDLEQRRKDHVQMFTHHIITNSLLIGSYLTNMSDMGYAGPHPMCA